eukprot:g4070.t1
MISHKNILLLACVVALAASEQPAASPTAPDVVLVGATGNLAQKYLWQILFDLERAGKVGRVFGGATKPKEKGTALIGGIIRDKIRCDSCEYDEVVQFKRRVEYVQLRNDEQYGELGAKLDAAPAGKDAAPGRLFFLSVSPDFYPRIAKNINERARPKGAGDQWLRVIFEKPFGRDLASSRALADALSAEFAEHEIYRIDHYLGKAAVQAVGEFRRANTGTEHGVGLEGLLNKEHVASVDVIMKETETCEGRTKFYNRYGVIRDVLQNHLSEILAFVAGELPAGGGDGPVDRAGLLAQVLPAAASGVRVGAYEGYAQHVADDAGDGEAEGSPARLEPTAAIAQLFVDSERWRGVPFTLSAGKGLDERVAAVRIRFKSGARGARVRDGCEVVMQLQGGAEGYKQGAFIDVCADLPAPRFPAGWRHSYKEEGGTVAIPESKAPNPYFVLVSGAIQGRRDLFVGTAELLELWRVWTPVLQQLEQSSEPLLSVKVGDVADGRRWGQEAAHFLAQPPAAHKEL